MIIGIVLKILDLVIKDQQLVANLIVQTYLGSQYTDKEFEKALREQKTYIPIVAKERHMGNYCIKSLHAILKKGEVYHNFYYSFKKVRLIFFGISKVGITVNKTMKQLKNRFASK